MKHLNKKKIINDKGLSLVEMVIVIAMITLMAGAAMVTITMINSAKAREAGVTFDSEFIDTSTKAKSQICVVEGEKKPEYRYCLDLYQASSGKYFLRHGYYNPKGTTDAEKYIFIDADNSNGGNGINLSNKVDITYTTFAGKKLKVNDSGDKDTINHVYIVFNTDGTIKEGFGTYTFYKRNGNEVSNVVIRKNGSHRSD